MPPAHRPRSPRARGHVQPNGNHTDVLVPCQAVSAQTVDSLAAAQAFWQP